MVNPWIYWPGVGVVVIGALVLQRALTGDWFRWRRSGRTPRCPRCWYDMTGAAGLTCPECGRVARSARRLLKPRRYWRRAALGLLLVALGTIGMEFEPLSRFDWVRQAPSYLLARLLEDPSPPPVTQPGTGAAAPALRKGNQQRIFDEIMRRYGAGTLPASAKRVLARTQFDEARPFMITTRAAWPEGVPVRVAATGSFAGVMARELRAAPEFEGGKPIVLSHPGFQQVASIWAPSGPLFWVERREALTGLQSIGTPPPGTTEVWFRTTITEGGEVIWTGRVRQGITLGGTGMGAVATQDATWAMMTLAMDSLRLSLARDTISIVRSADPALVDLTVGLVVEVCHDDRTVCTARLLWRNSAAFPTDEQVRYWKSPEPQWRRLLPAGLERRALLVGDLGALGEADMHDAAWFVRVRGDLETALDDTTGTRYWEGRFTLPLSVMLLPEK